jgi:polysaccharide chain length determinant protein (PEP-CTERM system associated)
MINSQKSFALHDYLDIFLKRKWYFIIPLVLVIAGTFGYLAVASKWYRSSTLVMVSPQKIPQDYVKATVTSGIEERLSAISQEILSRTRLEQVIKEFNLYPDQVKSQPLESVVEAMRKDIMIDVPKNDREKNHFAISYVGKDPRLVAAVTNKLSSLFIEENLKMREQQAQGTSEFLGSELKTKQEQVDRTQEEITNFKRRFINELPENRDANLKVLEQLNLQSQKIHDAVRAAEDRKLSIQNQLANIPYQAIEPGREGFGGATASGPRPPMMVQLSQLKGQLEELQAKYTENHPDIVVTKKKITDLEKRLAETQGTGTGADGTKKGKTGDPVQDQYNVYQSERKTLLDQIDREIARLKKEDEKVRVMIAQYQGRIENTPIRELTLSNLTRQFNNQNESYQVLIKKSTEAQQAENLERRQKGEQFRVLDPARVPEKPFKPDVAKVLLIGLVLALGSGLGLTFLREQMDRSFRDAEDLEVTLGLRVLANIPRVEKKAA